jgi:hypothetical protein
VRLKAILSSQVATTVPMISKTTTKPLRPNKSQCNRHQLHSRRAVRHRAHRLQPALPLQLRPLHLPPQLRPASQSAKQRQPHRHLLRRSRKRVVHSVSPPAPLLRDKQRDPRQ